MTDSTLSNRIAVVTGGESGIGAACVTALAAAGADVAVIYYKDQKAGDYSNPGWFKHPKGTVAYELDGPVAEGPRQQGAGAAAMPVQNMPAKNIEVQVRKPGAGHAGH